MISETLPVKRAEQRPPGAGFQGEPVKNVGELDVPTIIAFIDDAHTFGGAQVALALAVSAIIQNTGCSVICVCTPRTAKAIEEVAGQSERLIFVFCPAALPLNIVTFPLRILSFIQIIFRLKEQSVGAWWLNLPGIEFCLAPLLVLKIFGKRHCTWLHTTETLYNLARGRSAAKRSLNRIRDLVANHFLFRLHPVLATPSKAASQIVRKRTGKNSVVPHLYPTVPQAASAPPPKKLADSTNLWMIGRIDFGHKNNPAAIEAFRILKKRRAAKSLTVVGDGPDMAELRRLCNDLQRSDGLTFSGWTANPWCGVGSDDVVLIPSFDETICLVAVEAMLRGVRLVTSPLPAFQEGIPQQFIATGFSGTELADQVECVLRMNHAEVMELYSHSLVKFSAEHFLRAFAGISRLDIKADDFAETIAA